MKYLFPLFGWLFISSSFNQKKTMDQYSSVPPSTQTLLSQMLEYEFIYTLIYLIPIQLHLFVYTRYNVMLVVLAALLCSATSYAMLYYSIIRHGMAYYALYSTTAYTYIFYVEEHTIMYINAR